MAHAKLCEEANPVSWAEQLDDCQRNEAVGRLLRQENQELWLQLLQVFADKRGAKRQVSFRCLSGDSYDVLLEPKQTLFIAKQQILRRLSPVKKGKRRVARFFDAGYELPENTLAAMLPDEVSVVFRVVDKFGLDFSSEEEISDWESPTSGAKPWGRRDLD
mmetsp:Transcript_37392/g.69793  ORF Transcript_37392/g.69793 Transcript_37392/m.69793 type:complete len:161 (+) Transcript_37392:24-506(+)